MKVGWKRQRFEECIEPVAYTRKIQRKAFLDAGAYPVLSQEQEFVNGYWDDESDLFTVTTPVVVFGDHTRVLKYVDFDFVLGADGVKILKPRAFLSPKFFYYQLQAAPLESMGYARHYRLLEGLQLAYPEWSEQQRIVGILDEAFEGIAAAKASAEKNLLSARALFVSHLQSALAWRGSDWQEVTLGRVCTFENGDRGANYPSRTARTAVGIPFINAGHLTDDGLDLDSLDYISRERFELLGGGKIRNGDILFCLRGSLGKFASVRGVSEGAIASSLVIVRPTRAVLSEFVEAYFRSPQCFEMIGRFRNGAAQPNLSAGSLRQFRLPLPPLPVQVEIVETLGLLRAEIQCLTAVYGRKLAALDELKKSLLHRAFSGQL